MKKKIIPLILTLLLILCISPEISLAADNTISADDSSYNLATHGHTNGDTITIAAGCEVTLVGNSATTYTNFKIVCGEGVTLTLSNVNINNSATDYSCPLSFMGSGNTLKMASGTTSTLTSGGFEPGVRVETDTELTIEGPGTLSATGSKASAGIGGGSGQNCGSIVITGGTINATGTSPTSASSGAGIGGGVLSSGGGSVTISGGTVNAVSTRWGAGIGGGHNSAGCTVTITGGTVTARSATVDSLPGHDIGSGYGGSSGGTLSLDGAAYVYLQNSGTNATLTKGDFYISDDSNAIADGYYVDGNLFTGTVINMSTGSITGGGGASYTSPTVTISDSANSYLITGSTTGKKAYVHTASSTPTDIILFNAGINFGSDFAFGMYESNVSMRLCGKNTLSSSKSGTPGLYCPIDTTISISGDGSLNAEGGYEGAGIGGGMFDVVGTIKISGGTITAQGGGSAAGIGGGYYNDMGTIEISGTADVTATGGSSGAGIGGGIMGGLGGTITITGGTVNATGGDNAAGIGSGAGASGALVSGGTIKISGGTVDATAGENAAAIGTGQYGDGGTIEVSGTADVTATGIIGEDGTGIGWGKNSTGGSITISDGTVDATGTKSGAGIGGDADDGTITISGGNVTAMGSTGSAAIGGAQERGAGTITITGGIIDATSCRGAAIGGGSSATVDGTVEISGDADVTATSLDLGTGIGSGQSSTAAVDVTISGTPDVTATGGTSSNFGGAGIGSGAVASSCDVTIEGGTVTATGAKGAAGIGGGLASSGGTILISGGTITATGSLYSYDGNDYSGAGIGGGAYYSGFGGGASGDITISGGVVYASGATGADDIGYGSGYTGTSGSFAVSGTAAVFMKNDVYTTPDTTTHTHEEPTEDVTSFHGISVPEAWTANFGAYLRLYTLTYSTNGGSGTAPDSVTQHIDTTVSVESVGSYTKTGYTQGTGWNTAANGSGSNITAGSTFTFDQTETLFAKWTANTYTVEYDANGGSGTTADSSHTYDVDKALTANGFTRTGYTFAGWAASASGAAAYTDSESVKNLTATDGGTVTLYAKWTANTYTVKYDANGGTGTTADSSHTYDADKALTANGFTKTGYTFAGWATSATGAAAYTDGENVKNLTATDGGTVTLYAKWTVHTYTVKYDANGGSGTMADSSHTYDAEKALTLSGFTREYYVFAGWSSTAGGSVVYSDGQSVKNLTATDKAAVTLYAKWTAVPTLGSSDEDGKIYVGGRVVLTPNIEGGTWSWDEKFFSATFNSPATFTALKAGTSTVTYTVEGVSVSYTVTAEAAVLPETGQDFTWVWVLGAAAIVIFVGALLFFRRRRRLR